MKTTLSLTTTLLFVFGSLVLTNTVLINLVTNTVNAAEQKKMTLWEQDAPNALGTEEKDKPRITVWFPDKSNATDMAVVVCPGGGYGGLALDHEGKQIGEWFHSFGVTAIILEYRHRGKGYGHPNPLLDVQRAIRTVRFNAKDWEIDPAKIGVMGFSAGGHLASTAGTHFENMEKPNDEIDKMSCRPDFMILCYPVILFDVKFTHRGSQHNLIGANAPKELVEYYSNEKQVTEKTPPTFIFFTNEDKTVPAENGIEFYLALRKYKIPAELHIYQKGAHGQGLAKKQTGNEMWTELCKAWLINNGFLKK
ncbi:MAG: alpha/beta hydrolase [Planctomycetaceae bacterium]|jgi:acetyl esterase/lipase|nr:alpha/beta hydrolase [Planctomycetaceae bacterium]